MTNIQAHVFVHLHEENKKAHTSHLSFFWFWNLGEDRRIKKIEDTLCVLCAKFLSALSTHLISSHPWIQDFIPVSRKKNASRSLISLQTYYWVADNRANQHSKYHRHSIARKPRQLTRRDSLRSGLPKYAQTTQPWSHPRICCLSWPAWIGRA